jgi:hypothetical protein
MKDMEEERISQIHHSALHIAAQAHLCASNQRVGREWLRQMKHSSERIAAMIERLESNG